MNENYSPEQFDDENLSRGERIRPTMSPVAAGFLGLIIVFFLYQFVGGILTLLVFGMDLENADMDLVRLMTMGGQILFILLPALLFSKFIYEDVGYIIRFNFPSWKEILVFTLGLLLITPLLQSFMYIQNYLFDMLAANSSILSSLKEMLDALDEMVNESYAGLLESSSIFESLFVIIVVAVTPAICEETFFRGFVQKSFEFKLKPFLAVSITALFFAFYHFNPYGFISLLALGAFFGFAAYKSDSIFVPLTIHFLNNFIAILAFLIYGKEDFMEEGITTTAEFMDSLLIFIFFLALFSVYIYLTIKYYHKLKPEEKK